MSINISDRRIKSLPEQVADNRKRIDEIALNKSLYQHIIQLDDDNDDIQIVFSLFTSRAEPMTKADVVEYLESKGFDGTDYLYPAKLINGNKMVTGFCFKVDPRKFRFDLYYVPPAIIGSG